MLTLGRDSSLTVTLRPLFGGVQRNDTQELMHGVTWSTGGRGNASILGEIPSEA
jgi:hypothetical protein